MKSLKFNQVTGGGGDMKSAKTFNGVIHFHDGCIYAMGGNERDICERFDMYQSKWDIVNTYGEIVQGSVSELNGWCQIYLPGRPMSVPNGGGGAMMQQSM